MLDKNNCINKEKVISKNSTYYVYNFKCLNCENIIKAQSSHLKTHSGKCRRCTQLGIPYLHIFNELKNHHNKKVDFNLTFDEFLEIISNKKCHYCNNDLHFNAHSKNWGVGLSRSYQLDRKNNLEGYNIDNCVSCCWECNRLKSDRFTYDEYMKISPVMIEIYKNRNNENI